jgi:hypothetical protein
MNDRVGWHFDGVNRLWLEMERARRAKLSEADRLAEDLTGETDLGYTMRTRHALARRMFGEAMFEAAQQMSLMQNLQQVAQRQDERADSLRYALSPIIALK